MKKTYFMNPGVADVKAMMTFGVSAKKDDDAIGYFGTGFKYAVAIVLRTGGKINMMAGGELYHFDTEKREVRGKTFEFVRMNGVETGFTTHLGANWEPWMAYRELYSNCIDEDGEVSNQSQAPENGQSYETIIEVESELIHKCFQETNRYFLRGREPIFKTDDCEIYDFDSPFIYYRGVAIQNCKDAMFTYNVLCHLPLTEDRTPQYDFYWEEAIAKAVQCMDEEDLLWRLLGSDKKFEQSIDYSSSRKTSDAFVTVAKSLMKTDKGLPERARTVVKKLQEKNKDFPEFVLNDVQAKQLGYAIRFLGKMDIDIRKYPIKFVTGLGPGVLARALDGTMYLSETLFDLGTKQVASALMEEWVHLKYDCDDFSREMQNWLFDKILSLGENINREPL